MDREAEHMTYADSHVAVAAEVVIDLYHIADGAEPRKAVICKKRVIENTVGDIPGGICNEELFRKTGDKPADTVCRLLGRERALIYLERDIMVFYDRAGDELWEKGDIQQKLRKAFRALGWIAGYIDGVGKPLKGVERNTDRKRKAETVYIGPGNGIDVTDDKVGILEKAQDAEVQNNGSGKNEPLPAEVLHQQKPGYVIDKHRAEEYGHIHELTEREEDNACAGKEHVAASHTGQNSVYQKHGR